MVKYLEPAFTPANDTLVSTPSIFTRWPLRALGGPACAERREDFPGPCTLLCLARRGPEPACEPGWESVHNDRASLLFHYVCFVVLFFLERITTLRSQSLAHKLLMNVSVTTFGPIAFCPLIWPGFLKACSLTAWWFYCYPVLPFGYQSPDTLGAVSRNEAFSFFVVFVSLPEAKE